MAIVARLINSCWFCFKWGLILLVLGAALAVPYFYRRMDEEIRDHMERHIAQQYPGLKVAIRSAVLVKGEGIEIRGLSILEPGAEGPRAELLTFEECFLHCRTDLQELIGGEPEITQVTMRRPTLRMTRRRDGSWSAAKLLPLPKLSKRAPQVTIENGTIEVFDPRKSPSSTLTLRDVNLTLTPAADGPTPTSPDETRKLQGTLSGDYFRHVNFEGVVQPHRPGFAISGSIEGLDISSELWAALPGTMAAKLDGLGAVRGQGELDFRVAYDAAAPTPLQFSLLGRMSRGRIDDRRLPHPLTDVRAVVRLDNAGFSIDELSASSNQATLRLAARGKSLEAGQPLAVQAEIRQLELDRQLVAVLPENLQEQWYKYRPDGQIDADVKLVYDGRRWYPQLSVRCLDVSFAHYKFPYRLEHGKGTLSLRDDVLQASLTAYSGNQLVHVDTQWQHLGSAATGWVEARGEGLPMDEKLLAALPDRSRAVARALDLRGTLDFQYRLWRQAAEERVHQTLRIDANRCWIRYEKFPYSLANIHGALAMSDGQWTFDGLEGTNGNTRVTCQGHLTPTPQGNELSLQFRANDVPLEEELRDALGPAMRQVWNYLKPRGMIDLVAELHYLDGPNLLGVTVRAEPRSEISSIEPTQFPYRLEKLQGVISYSNGHVTCEHFKAEHGAVKLAASGGCDFFPDGGWRLRLEGLSVDRLRVDRELMQALPARLKRALAEINPSGLLSLQGNFDLQRGGAPDDPVRSQWKLALGLHQAGLDCGVRLENIHGGLTLAGAADGRSFYTTGELALDLLTYKDYQFTQVSGPFWIDDGHVLLGTLADRRRNELTAAGGLVSFPPPGERLAAAQRPRSLRAGIFGGTVYGAAKGELGPQPRYGIHASLIDGQLARWAQETLVNRQNLKGQVMAVVDLWGTGRTRNTLGGRGGIELRNANIYELPVMISLLKLLSIRAPDANAFSKSDINFRIEGENIYFDRLDFTGDAISLLGKGEMNMQSIIHLAFTSIVGRGDIDLPLIRNLYTGASQQFMLIHVDGTLQNPEMRKEAFPGVNKALQRLQNDLQPNAASPGQYPAARGPALAN